MVIVFLGLLPMRKKWFPSSGIKSTSLKKVHINAPTSASPHIKVSISTGLIGVLEKLT